MLAEMSLQNIAEAQGVAIALTGMLIVFTALILISVFIAALPRLLASLEGVLGPEKEHHAAAAPRPSASATEEQLVAAIGYVLHLRRSRGR